MNYIIVKSRGEDVWTVGQGTPGSSSTWDPHSDHGSLAEAEECAAALNGVVTPARLESALADQADKFEKIIGVLREQLDTLENRLDSHAGNHPGPGR